MIDDIDFDLDPSIRLARLAYRIGKELGTEAKLFGRFNRGELDWDELTHIQQTLFLGGDRSKYEEIRRHLKRQARKSGRKEATRAPVARRPRFDYGKF